MTWPRVLHACSAFFACLLCLFVTGIIPKAWHRYSIPADLTVIQWVVDFGERIKQLQKVVKAAGTGVSELKVHITYFNCT